MGELRKRHQACAIQLAGVFFWLVALLLFSPGSAVGQSESDSWLILANGRQGSINLHTTRDDLVRIYGSANVVDQEVDLGEGELVTGTFVFPGDAERQIEILWSNPDRRIGPESIEIRGKSSRWHAVHGISLGTTLAELERINGRPFHFELVHDGTDMADELISWHEGLLEKEFQGEGRVKLWLERTSTPGTLKAPANFAGESDTPAMRNLNLHVTRITWLFPAPAQR